MNAKQIRQCKPGDRLYYRPGDLFGPDGGWQLVTLQQVLEINDQGLSAITTAETGPIAVELWRLLPTASVWQRLFRLGRTLSRVEIGATVKEIEVERLERAAHDLHNYLDPCMLPEIELHKQIQAAIEELTIECEGEAHRNAWIDHCALCMPRWGRRLGPRVVRRQKGVR